MSETTRAEVPLSFFEYKVSYEEPLIHAQKLYTEVTPAVFHALRNWNVALENVSARQNPTTFGEVAVTFSLLGGRVVWTVTLGFASVVVRDPDWSEAELLADIVKAGTGAVFACAGLVAALQRATIAMHVKPVSGRIKDFVTNIVRLPTQGTLTDGNIKAYGFSVYRQDSSWVVDTSASYSDALFMRIEHVMGAQVPFDEIASVLRRDETTLLDLLHLDIGLT
jgi:hypothetical protein